MLSIYCTPATHNSILIYFLIIDKINFNISQTVYWETNEKEERMVHHYSLPLPNISLSV